MIRYSMAFTVGTHLGTTILTPANGDLRNARLAKCLHAGR
jgi:hypothetical protein